MARKTVGLIISQPIPIGNVDVTFRVHDGRTHLGDVTVSQGSIDWRPSRARSSIKKRWTTFADLMSK